MTSPARTSSAVAYSIALHAVIVLAFALDIDLWRTRPAAPVQPDAIKASVVDAAVLEQARREREAATERAREAELERRREEEAERQAELERQRQEEQRRQQQEAERQAAIERERREEAEREAELERQRQQEAERQAELERQRREEAERQAELERQRAEEERRRQEEERRAAEEAREQAEREAQLAEQLAAEAERRQAREAGLLDQYRRDIQNVIQQNWIRPNSAQPGIECVVNVTQIPSGDVVSVRIGRCNGDDAVLRSIEQAVLRASPLPRPPVPSLFERNLDIIFSPDD